MRIVWNDNLINELAYKRCVIFIGSGISANSITSDGKSPLVWGDFINKAKSLASPNSIEFIDLMLTQKNYLQALQVVKDTSDPGEYANLLRETYSRPNFAPNEIHKAIKDINSKIVVTTNFDKIYENHCNEHGYTIANYYDPPSKIISNIKSPENLIIKAHGTIDDVNTLVFTESEYYKAKKEYPFFYEILKSLFLTHTILFVGYSLNDPDINLLIEFATYSNTSTNPNYVVCLQGVPDEVKRHWKDCYNIYALEYGPEYINLEGNILELRDAVITRRAEWNLPQ